MSPPWIAVAKYLYKHYTFEREGNICCGVCGEVITSSKQHRTTIYSRVYSHFMFSHRELFRKAAEEVARAEEERVRELERKLLEKLQGAGGGRAGEGAALLERVYREIADAICRTVKCSPDMIREVLLSCYFAARKYIPELQQVPAERAVTLADKVASMCTATRE